MTTDNVSTEKEEVVWEGAKCPVCGRMTDLVWLEARDMCSVCYNAEDHHG